MIHLSLAPGASGQQERLARLPGLLCGRWCEFRLQGLPTAQCRVAMVFDGAEDTASHPRVLAPRRDGTAYAILYVPADARTLRLEVLGNANLSPAFQISARVRSRPHAAALLLARSPGGIVRAALGGPKGWMRRVRTALVRSIEGNADPQYSFELWRMLFDQWPVDAAAPNAAYPEIRVFVMCPDGAAGANTHATLASLNRQLRPVRFDAIAYGQPLVEAAHSTSEPYIAVLQAGELLRPHATALISAWIARHGTAPALCADEDHVALDGSHHSPHFKPQPNRPLVLSGTLGGGIWVFRRDLFLSHAPAQATWAECIRLELWLRAYEMGEADASQRIPFLLTSITDETERAPAGALTDLVRAHLERTGIEATVAAGPAGIRVRPQLPRNKERRVAIVIPSALRATHVSRCLRAVLEHTPHPALEVVLVVSQMSPLDTVQQQCLASIGSHPAIHVVMRPVERFSYAGANNHGVRCTDAEFVCLMNDDVAPVGPDWLDAMLGQCADPEVFAVGARLLYPNGLVQHAGVIMGMGGLADHAHRLLPRAEPGYFGRAVLNQDVSAATAACLLVRRSVYEHLGGMDETYPIAFNDVDLCLKIREAGHRVVYCADAELLHYESLSLGHHFSGDRAALESVEVRRMRRRWPGPVADDPFHNPNLSLSPGHEFDPAFPPRIRLEKYARHG